MQKAGLGVSVAIYKLVGVLFLFTVPIMQNIGANLSHLSYVRVAGPFFVMHTG